MHPGILLAVVAVATYFGYYYFPVPVRPWVFYPASGLLSAASGWVAHILCAERYASTHQAGWLAGVAAAALMMSEGLQQAVCGLIDARTGGVDVCRAAMGGDAYTILASMAGAALVMTPWLLTQLRK